MVEIEDIVDRKSLKAWLKEQPQRFSVVIVHRIAIRALPMYWNHVLPSADMREGDLDIMPVLRACLISGAGAYSPFAEVNPELVEASILAAFQAPTNLSLTYTSDDGKITTVLPTPVHPDVASATTAAYSAARTAATPSSIEAAEAAALAAHTAVASSDAWNVIRFDCNLLSEGEDLSQAPIWASGEIKLRAEWAEVKAGLSKENIDWQFWIKWYEAALAGKPLPWILLERIALEVKEEDWARGRKHVNGLIVGIEAEFVTDALPQVDRMDIDPETGLVETTPIVTTAEKIVLTSLKQVKFSYSVAKSGNCGLNFGSVASLYLEETFECCRDDANAILQNYQVALDDIRMGLTSGDYQTDGKLSALVVVLEKEIVNLLANHPEVKKADRARIAHHLSLAKADVKLQIVEELDFAKAAAGVRLDAEMSLDSKLVAQEGESPAQTRAAQRLFGRIAQMYVTMKNASAAAVRKIDAATGYKFARILATLGKIVGWITSLFGG